MTEWVEYTDALLEEGCEIRCDTGCVGLVGIVGKDRGEWYIDWQPHPEHNRRQNMSRWSGGHPALMHNPPDQRLSIRPAGPPNY